MVVKFAIYLRAAKTINTPAIGQFITKNRFQLLFYTFQAAVRTEGAA